MAVIRRKTYENIHGTDVVFKRLRTEVAANNPPLVHWRTGTTIDTSFPWVGTIDENKNSFTLVRTNPSIAPLRYLDGIFFIIFVDGQVAADGQKARINVDYRIEWGTVAQLLMGFALVVLAATHFLVQERDKSSDHLMFGFLVFLFIPVSLLFTQLHLTEKKIARLLGAGE